MRTSTTFELESGCAIQNGGSTVTESLRERIDLLKPNDRLLIELALSGNHSHRRIAELLEIEPGSVSRRVRRVARRLHEPVVRRLMEERCPLPAEYRQIGVEHFLTGMSTKELAEKHGVAAGQVRRVVQFLRWWSRGTSAGKG